MIRADYIQLARQTATDNLLDPQLVCAVVEQESSWNTYAIRYEPAFYERYVAPHFPAGTEAVSRSTSWGLMQLMGECAREMGYQDKFLSTLCDPQAGLTWGCKWLRRKMVSSQGNVLAGLLAWNGGSDKQYPAQVMSRMAKYGNVPTAQNT